MPKIFRTMFAIDGSPEIGREANKLGVRLPTPGLPEERVDITPDNNGIVYPRLGGLSVAKSVDDLPPHTVPKYFKSVVQGASASDNRFVWSMGNGSFSEGGIAHKLILRLKPMRSDGKVQGLVEPAKQMFVEDYQSSLAATQSLWSIDEPMLRI